MILCNRETVSIDESWIDPQERWTDDEAPAQIASLNQALAEREKQSSKGRWKRVTDAFPARPVPP